MYISVELAREVGILPAHRVSTNSSHQLSLVFSYV